MFDVSIEDAIPPAFLYSLLALTVAYHIFAPLCSTVKQQSWILTTISSAAMSLSSLPLFFLYASSRGDLRGIRSTLWTESTGRFFQAYLVTDLLMGVIYYRSKVNLLTGWIHHTIYIFIVEYACRQSWSHLFALCGVMEIPTFLLAIASLNPRFRSDVVFAMSFLATRIVLHVFLCVSMIASRHHVTNDSYGPGLIMACIFPLHAFWFYGSLKGFVKRAKSPKSQPVSQGTVTASGFTSLRARSWMLPRRRGSLRQAVRAWDRLELRKAAGRFGDVQRRLRASIPAAREQVYAYVGLERLPSGEPQQTGAKTESSF
ncbi:uncharacterized protein F5147DRAFT_717459 [Suillus discolor]|uniref:TLC domain-containing protein n=2 Tax=Suillus TaxID=5379 RepID=A0A9P7EWW9_9AGAM|nr:uncharacterized protein F5147DRAFT_717459 [Suillus discolor]KAG2095888.1 hypothetical protein F5147DRAFT_717459 [Suillus discolor]